MSPEPTVQSRDEIETGLRALRLLSEHLSSSRATQFAHTWYPNKEPQYTSTHYPDRCATCAQITAIETALLIALRGDS